MSSNCRNVPGVSSVTGRTCFVMSKSSTTAHTGGPTLRAGSMTLCRARPITREPHSCAARNRSHSGTVSSISTARIVPLSLGSLDMRHMSESAGLNSRALAHSAKTGESSAFVIETSAPSLSDACGVHLCGPAVCVPNTPLGLVSLGLLLFHPCAYHPAHEPGARARSCSGGRNRRAAAGSSGQ
jgi:hypothetical protein